MRVVFDTNVHVSALIGGSAPRDLADVWTRTRPFELIVSPKLLAQPTDVLGREMFRRWISLGEASTLTHDSRTRRSRPTIRNSPSQ